MKNKIKRFYDMGLYTKIHVRQFVNKGIITEKDYIEIVGEE